MKIFLIILSVILIVAVVLMLFMVISAPKKKDYEHLTAPRIIEKPDVSALIVPFDGDPNVVLKEAFGDMFKAYYKVKGAPKGPTQLPSVARYENFDDKLHDVETMTQEELKSVPWKGFTAIPVPAGSTLPEGAPSSVRLETLSYGTIAEVIHFGPYDQEKPVIIALKKFIEDEGYEIVGLHEEEYILGPGMPFSKPEKYITFIRYQVKRK